MLARISVFADAAVVQQMKGTAKKSSGARFTIPERFSAVNDHHGKPAAAAHVAAIDLLATWRNHFVHGDRRFPLAKASRTTLLSADSYFRSQQGGADISAILAEFDNRSGPRPEDIITLISAAQLGVAALDQHLLFSVASKDYAFSLMAFMLSENEDPPALLERVFRYGGKNSSGAAFALMMKHRYARAKGAFSPVAQMPRQDFDAVRAMGRNRASELFGIARP